MPGGAVPWCEDCSQFHERSAIGRDGQCPGCGRVIVKAARVPWHFKLLLVATVIYLAYRLVQGVLWAVHHL